MNKPVLITGGSGLLALNWALALRARAVPAALGLHYRTIALAGVAISRVDLDSADAAARVLDVMAPRLVVHAAGMTSVEGCEADPAQAHKVNVMLAEHVARACAARRVPLVQISTDHLVPGDRAMADENQPISPRNVYARTKAEAEVRVREAHPGALVVRTNFYGWGPLYRQSFSERIVLALRQSLPITLFTDVYYTPILAEALVETVHELVDRQASGVFHVVGDERLSKHEFGLRLARQFGLDPALIRAGCLRDEPALVPRPSDMSLSNAKARGVLGRPLGNVDAHLARLRQQEQLGFSKELQSL